MIENGSKIAENCTSTLVKKRKPCTVPNPFSKPFELILTKEKVDQVITTFCDKFDFKKNFKMNSAQIEQIRQVLTLGLVPRLFYHLAKYIHAILVLGIEDLSSYIRIGAIWYMCQAKYPPNDELSVLSPVLVMFKVCSVLIFATEAPKYYITNQKDMEATLFNIIEKMLNPYHLFDSMRDQPKTQHAPKPIRIPTGRSLADIINLVENHQLLEEDGIIARAMLNQNAPMDLLKILSNEPWGDLIQEEIEEEDTRDNMLALPIQRIIQQDIIEMNWKNPHPVSDWMKVDPSKLNLKNFNRPSKIEPSASLRKLATLPRTPVTRSQVDKSFRRQSAGIKARNSLPSDLNILPFSNSSSSLLVEDDLNAF